MKISPHLEELLSRLSSDVALAQLTVASKGDNLLKYNPPLTADEIAHAIRTAEDCMAENKGAKENTNQKDNHGVVAPESLHSIGEKKITKQDKEETTNQEYVHDNTVDSLPIDKIYVVKSWEELLNITQYGSVLLIFRSENHDSANRELEDLFISLRDSLKRLNTRMVQGLLSGIEIVKGWPEFRDYQWNEFFEGDGIAMNTWYLIKEGEIKKKVKVKGGPLLRNYETLWETAIEALNPEKDEFRDKQEKHSVPATVPIKERNECLKCGEEREGRWYSIWVGEITRYRYDGNSVNSSSQIIGRETGFVCEECRSKELRQEKVIVPITYGIIVSVLFLGIFVANRIIEDNFFKIIVPMLLFAGVMFAIFIVLYSLNTYYRREDKGLLDVYIQDELKDIMTSDIQKKHNRLVSKKPIGYEDFSQFEIDNIILLNQEEESKYKTLPGK